MNLFRRTRDEERAVPPASTAAETVITSLGGLAMVAGDMRGQGFVGSDADLAYMAGYTLSPALQQEVDAAAVSPEEVESVLADGVSAADASMPSVSVWEELARVEPSASDVAELVQMGPRERSDEFGDRVASALEYRQEYYGSPALDELHVCLTLLQSALVELGAVDVARAYTFLTRVTAVVESAAPYAADRMSLYEAEVGVDGLMRQAREVGTPAALQAADEAKAAVDARLVDGPALDALIEAGPVRALEGLLSDVRASLAQAREAAVVEKARRLTLSVNAVRTPPRIDD